MLFFFYCYGYLRDLHSFPTRRSSDLLAPEDVLSIAGPIDLTFFMKFVSALPNHAALRYEELKPLPPQDLIGENSKIGRDTSELQSPVHLVCRLLLEKKKRQLTFDN